MLSFCYHPFPLLYFGLPMYLLKLKLHFGHSSEFYIVKGSFTGHISLLHYQVSVWQVSPPLGLYLSDTWMVMTPYLPIHTQHLSGGCYWLWLVFTYSCFGCSMICSCHVGSLSSNLCVKHFVSFDGYSTLLSYLPSYGHLQYPCFNFIHWYHIPERYFFELNV